MAISAVHYAGLVGKYIRMERPATSPEKWEPGDSTIGMECTVVSVQDVPDGSVVIYGDEGHQFPVRDGEPWRFWIWPDEQTRRWEGR